MKAMHNTRRDSASIAVIRHYEPARIERELLAQVFEIVSHGAVADVRDEEQQEVIMTISVSRHDDLSRFGVESVDATKLDQRERAA